MVRVNEDLLFHFPVKMLNVGFLTFEEGISWLFGDADVKDFLFLILDWGYHVLPNDPKLAYPTFGFVRDTADLYYFGFVTDYVKLLRYPFVLLWKGYF
ncbi:hypothetical protein V6N12_026975 [Hibiscus sabdariffa]|uniref:Uncharacterized protein n=1 Tax=Hibiscus sabdariffa TaxID=183260 RepID=A0ABR2DTE1_9ROSI